MRRNWQILLLLASTTVALFWRVSRHEFVNYDDYAYVTLNPMVQQGLTWQGVAWAFGQLHGEATYWHPLTWLSHMLDCQLFGLRPAGHHLGNLFFHTVNTLLLFVLLERMTGRRGASAVVAALFALHPLQADSVAWVAERKNVLSTLFWFLTLLAYLRYAARPNWRRYVPVFMLMALGLMAKPTLVTLPCVMLLLDFWPLGRLQLGSISPSPAVLSPPPEPRRSRRKAAHSISGERSQSLLTSTLRSTAAEDGSAATVKEFKARNLESLPAHATRWTLGWLLLEKLPLLALSAASSLLTVRGHEALGALVQTNELPLLYRLENAAVAYAIYLRKLVWPTDLSVFYMHPGRWPTAAVVASALLLLSLTAVGLMQARRRPFLLVGWFWFIGTLVPTIGLVQAHMQALADRFAYVPVIGVFIMVVWTVADWTAAWPRSRAVQTALTGLALAGCAVMTSLQLGYWQNSVTLLQHAVQLAPNHFLPHVMLGNALFERSQLDGALREYREALRLRQDDADAWERAGVVLSQQSQPTEAMAYFQRAIQLAPAWAEPRRRLALALLSQGRKDEARIIYEEIAPLLPATAEGHREVADMLAEGQQPAAAIRHYQEALRLNPNFLPVLSNLAWLRATCSQSELRDGLEAVSLAERACQLSQRRNPNFLGVLAAAYAEAGRFSEAIKTIQEAQTLAQATGTSHLLPLHTQMLERFQAGKPFRESPR
jgi:tetratricopeptide (TPR) repeat protein